MFASSGTSLSGGAAQKNASYAYAVVFIGRKWASRGCLHDPRGGA